jgi:SP family arabinose:H+ symporter-like MFS transporter
MPFTLNRYVARGAIVGALGGLLFGFDTAVISGTLDSLKQVYALTPQTTGYTVAIALVGTVLGAVAAGPLETRYGGRAMLRWMAVLYLLSALGCALAPSWSVLMLARFIGGIGIGGSSVLGPVYIAEISPAHLRGRLVGMFQINIVIGVLLAYLSNYLIAGFDFGAAEWRIQFGVAALPAALFFALLFTIPPSARWLAAKGRYVEARTVLAMVGSPDPDVELDEFIAAIAATEEADRETLFQRKYTRLILLAIAVAFFNQLSGINAITYYLNDIFAAAGFGKMSSSVQAVAFGAMNLFATLIGMTFIDRIGRVKLLLIGAVGTAICLFGVAVVYSRGDINGWLLPLLVTYIFFFAISQGSVIWVYLSEIFPTNVRGKGQSLGSSTHWVMNAIIAAAFPVIARSSKVFPFVFFGAMVVIQFVVVKIYFPETKGVSLEELQHNLGVEQ